MTEPSTQLSLTVNRHVSFAMWMTLHWPVQTKPQLTQCTTSQERSFNSQMKTNHHLQKWDSHMTSMASMHLKLMPMSNCHGPHMLIGQQPAMDGRKMNKSKTLERQQHCSTQKRSNKCVIRKNLWKAHQNTKHSRKRMDLDAEPFWARWCMRASPADQTQDAQQHSCQSSAQVHPHVTAPASGMLQGAFEQQNTGA